MRILSSGVAALSAAVLACGLSLQAQAPVLALVGVHIVPMDRERVVERQTVIIRDGVITEIGPQDRITPPAGAQVVALTGKYVMPAIGEMHGHLAGSDAA
nr:amidohydrolase [Acidobacteriota bacterium]